MEKPLFTGIVIDEYDQPVETGYIGEEPCYIVNDAGFKRHILAEYIDRQVWDFLTRQIKGNEDLIANQTAQMLGQDDLFSYAMIMQQLTNVDKQFESLQKNGIPADALAYMGMMGFKVIVDIHGDVIRIEQPTAPSQGDDE
ncbi:MAG TPA: hypothetical protein PLI60_06645 [Anaerolineaceae bacterium]|nr:hypothetical protein [Anaerolineaceae bacterium]HPC06381.1 hypothetical protein [Anaerolineaceae bacterium]